LKLIKELKNLVVLEEFLTLRESMEVIDRGALQIAMVLDPDGNLVGILTDGDVRRALLLGSSLEDSASNVINRSPICIAENSQESTMSVATKYGLNQVILGKIGLPPVGIFVTSAGSKVLTMPPALVMAGGKGIRLRPVTKHTPKPLVEVAGTPVLHRVLKSLSESGFTKVFISVNYLADQIENSIGDGGDFGLEVEYVHEEEAMGTAGSIGLIPNFKKIEEILVMNADLVADIDFPGLVAEHKNAKNDFTVLVRENITQVPFGVIRMANGVVGGVQEKPSYSDLVSAGVYCISNSVTALISASPLDMPALINTAISNGRRVGAYPMHRSWIDIGSREDLDRANLLLSGES